MIAAAAVCAAMDGFQSEVETSREAMLQTMHQITNIEQVLKNVSILSNASLLALFDFLASKVKSVLTKRNSYRL